MNSRKRNRFLSIFFSYQFIFFFFALASLMGCESTSLLLSPSNQFCDLDQECEKNSRCFHGLCLSNATKNEKADGKVRLGTKESFEPNEALVADAGTLFDANGSFREKEPQEKSSDPDASAPDAPVQDASSIPEQKQHIDTNMNTTNRCAPSKEICDGKDNDCDGRVDEPEDLTFPSCAKQAGVCRGAKKRCGGVKGWLPCTQKDYLGHDADYELSESKCDEKDNNCDGKVDENVRYYRDRDLDGYGNTNESSCSPKRGYVTRKGDCNDFDRFISPAASFSGLRNDSVGYDYNCDGKEEKQYTKKAKCPSNCQGIVLNQFKKGAIACGQAGNFLYKCEPFPMSKKCKPWYIWKFQKCR